MNINRYNYEEYFILYTDNELDHTNRKLVELFVQQNPDLEEELVMLQQSKLMADDSIVFGDKEALLKETGSSVNLNNYEEWLLLYVDNELTVAQKIAVKKLADEYPQVKKELELLQKTKLQPEEYIVFSGKESLYRRSEKVRVIAIRWWRIAAAAVLLFAVSATAFILLNRNNDNDTNEGFSKTTEEVKDNSGTVQTDSKTKTDVTLVDDNSNNADRTTGTNISGNKPNGLKKEYSPVQVKEDLIAKEEKDDMDDLPESAYSRRNMESSRTIADLDLPSKDVLTNPKENISVSNVTPEFATPLYYTDVIDTEQPEKKNKLRGFFRKVTRTFEKRTNIQATDEDDRLLIGGLAIKL